MRISSWLVVLLVPLLVTAGLAATKDDAKPDREMLRMIDFLREMEVIKNMDLMQDLTAIEQTRDETSGKTTPKMSTGRKKEAVK